jgi:replicative DNA helicase
MNLENALRKVAKVRGDYYTRHLNESKVYSGVNNLDQLLGGFDSNKFYTILAKPGNGIYSFAHTIATNIDVLCKIQRDRL